MQEQENQIFYYGMQLIYLQKTIRINHLCNRYVKDKYRSVSATIGVEFAYKVAVLKNKTKVKA